MSSIVISDLHLCEDRPQTFLAFQRFCDSLSEEVQELYILGDLFEAWLGDDDLSDFNRSVINCFKQLSDRGVSVFIQRGNRDFLLGNQFCTLAGAQLLEEQHVFNRYGQTALLMHGDTLCTDDKQYQRWRKAVYTPVIYFVLKNLPLITRRYLGKKLRNKSQRANSMKADSIMDVNTHAVILCLEKAQLTTLIHGHTHRPKSHNLPQDKQRIVLGDWGEFLWWITIDRNGFALQSESVNRFLETPA